VSLAGLLLFELLLLLLLELLLVCRKKLGQICGRQQVTRLLSIGRLATLLLLLLQRLHDARVNGRRRRRVGRQRRVLARR